LLTTNAPEFSLKDVIVKIYITGYWLVSFYLSIASHKNMANNKKGDSFSLDFLTPTSKLNASITMAAVQYFSHSHPRNHTQIIIFKDCIFMLNRYAFFSFLVQHHNWIQTINTLLYHFVLLRKYVKHISALLLFRQLLGNIYGMFKIWVTLKATLQKKC